MSARSVVRFLSTTAVAFAFVLLCQRARAESVQIQEVELVGASKTRASTILDLFPRPPPATYTDAELVEIERRINNLAVFDAVTVERDGARLRIVLQEKWTIIPSFDFSSGKTLADTFAMIGVTEYNALGTANAVGAAMWLEQRGWGVGATYTEHQYRRTRWSFGVESSFSTARYRFDDGNGWRATQGSGGVVFTSPPVFSDYLNFRLGLGLARETIDEARGPTVPADSVVTLTTLGIVWDRYRWKDLVPRGLKIETNGGTGVMFGPPVYQPRHWIETQAIGAVPLGPTTVLMGRVAGGVYTRGNPLFSGLVGSVSGVRGLEDALYRNWVQSYVNVELRHSIPIARRWAVQAVAFADGAVFERLRADGTRGDVVGALATGAGLRIVPTWLANVVLRFDLSRLMAPNGRWFYQLALSQYF